MDAPNEVIKGPDSDGNLCYFCPGCKLIHSPRWDGIAGGPGPRWKWNQDKIKPTIEPSVLTWYPTDKPRRCHHYVRDGKLQFLSDCNHELAWKTVDMIPDPWQAYLAANKDDDENEIDKIQGQ